MDALKSRINSYWTRRAPSFAALRAREYSSEKHDRWLAEFDRCLPRSRKLDILDIGTGTGFFALLLTEKGHRVTGVDLSEEMIRYAKANAERAGADAAFYVMDAERPDFPPASFDAIVTRNLTWTLPHLEEAYTSWFSLLRPGGVLVNFDADYCYCVTKKKEHVLPENHAHKSISPEMMAETARYIGQSGAEGIKFQLLHVLEGTDLAEDYRKGLFSVLTLEEYIRVLESCVETIPADMVIHRLTGDGAKRELIAPLWSADKKQVLNAIHRAFERDGVIQGKHWNEVSAGRE